MKGITIAIGLLILVGCSGQEVKEHVSAAKLHINKQDNDAAIIELKNALQADPESAEARFLLASIYFDNYQYDDAEKEFEKALEFGHSAADILPMLAQSYQKTGADTALINLRLKGVALTEDELVQVNFYRLQAMLRQAKPEDARALFQSIDAIRTNSPFKPLAAIYMTLADEQVDSAKQQLEVLLTNNPTQADALLLKANMQLQDDDVRGAIQTYEAYINAFPKENNIAFLLAKLQVENNRSIQAEPIIDRLLAEYPNNPLLNQLKAIVRFNLKDDANALLYAEKTLEKMPGETQARLIAGVSAYLGGDLKTANQHLSFIADELPSSHQALRILADTQLRLGLTLDANKTVQGFDSISEQDSTLLSGVGRALMRDGEIKRANDLLEKQPKQVTSVAALTDLGLLKLSLNDLSGILDLENALDKEKQQNADASPVALEQILARAYLTSKRYDKALALAVSWQDNPDTKFDGLMLAGSVYTQQGKMDQAKQQYQAAKTLQPTNPAVDLAVLDTQPVSSVEDRLRLFAQLDELIQQYPTFSPAIVSRYYLAKLLNQPVRMIAHLQQQRNLAPDNIDLAITLGQLQMLEGQVSQAIEVYESILTDEPAIYWEALANGYIQTKQFDKVDALYQRWIDKQPNNPLAIAGKVKALENSFKLEEALQLTTRYLNEQNASDMNIRLLHTHLLLQSKQFEQAQKSYSALPPNAQELPFAKGLAAQLQFTRQEYHLAKENIAIAYQDRPTPVNANLMYLTVKEVDGAAAAHDFIAKHVEDHPTDQFNIMTQASLEIQPDPDLAISLYEQAIKLNEKNFVALNNIAYLYLQKGELSKAREYAERALELKPQRSEILDTLAEIELKRGDYKSALSFASLAIDYAKGGVSDNTYLHYIEALLANKQFQLAQRAIDNHRFNDFNSLRKVDELKAKFAQ